MTVFFFEVMPRLAPGVIVQIHDIFIPDDYPAAWNCRLYNEQYLLAAMLLCGAPPFRVTAPVMYLCQDPAGCAPGQGVFAARGAGPDIPFLYPNDSRTPGASFWFEMTAQPAFCDPVIGGDDGLLPADVLAHQHRQGGPVPGAQQRDHALVLRYGPGPLVRGLPAE